MDKIIRAIFFLLLLNSCQNSKQANSEDFNTSIMLSSWMTFDYGSGVLMLTFRENDILYDTIEFTENEKRTIENSFHDNSIGRLRGEYRVGDPTEFPSGELRFFIKRNNENMSIFYWFPRFVDNLTDESEKRIDRYCRTLKDIIETKEEYKKMWKEQTKKQKQYNEYLF